MYLIDISNILQRSWEKQKQLENDFKSVLKILQLDIYQVTILRSWKKKFYKKTPKNSVLKILQLDWYQCIYLSTWTFLWFLCMKKCSSLVYQCFLSLSLGFFRCHGNIFIYMWFLHVLVSKINDFKEEKKVGLKRRYTYTPCICGCC